MGWGARRGGVHDDPLVAFRVVQRRAVQVDPAHIRVLDGLVFGAAGLYVLRGPQAAEPLAGRQQPPDQLVHTRVVRVAGDDAAQVGHRLAGEPVVLVTHPRLL